MAVDCFKHPDTGAQDHVTRLPNLRGGLKSLDIGYGERREFHPRVPQPLVGGRVEFDKLEGDGINQDR